jgi:hypothetical protein
MSRGTSVRRPSRSPGRGRLQRELAQQRQAEGVDRAHGDVAGAIAQLAPARRGNLATLGRDAERRQDAVAHLGRGLAGEGHGEDVRRVHARLQQVEVAVHQHARLAGAGRGLERDVEARIDGPLARGAVARVDARVERGVAVVVSNGSRGAPLLVLSST